MYVIVVFESSKIHSDLIFIDGFVRFGAGIL